MSGMEEEKVYIFVSHSHRDIDKVRLVRNYLEEKGAEPILFFLKSVTDDNEVADLIKREIDARLWFLYCRSRNAENSNWVRTELDYVKKTGKKNFFEIDLDRDLSFAAKEGGAGAAALTEKVARRLDACIDDLKTLRRVFVSYSLYDAAVAEKLIYALEKYGIEALYDAKISARGNWFSEIRSALDLAAVGADAADVLGAVAHTLKGGDCAAAARAAVSGGDAAARGGPTCGDGAHELHQP